jgi:hypothetical protein
MAVWRRPGAVLGFARSFSLAVLLCCVQVREVALEAIERARRGDGPTLIEAETYRFRGHSLADPDELRSKEEKARYQVSVAPVGDWCGGSAAGQWLAGTAGHLFEKYSNSQDSRGRWVWLCL